MCCACMPSAAQGRLLGASLLCEGGGAPGSPVGLGLQRGKTVEGMLQLPYYHPTVEEMMDTALRDMHRSLQSA